ncbi:translesion error-prone DNA polymerase V subunit UmuC [Vreelandella rituensis]|uniref:Translesion error-prone DNA polymerase V subunit UmuC n=1 Tax=Vreelandella rituensis TaxID=2282306 RepID=A0A368UDF7_9GAMM|nr:translesion error-prone DNA polymerase V subunit UmuC [Halomonas rituensis]RCV93803.1 translesion error-prone DNA polymerase V subunit UmuC [Halomonas rituensis]
MRPAPPAISIIDVNSCYVSIELLFKPWLRNRACIVLSNNDSACVARNSHAKALGIRMGQPWHEIAHLVRSGQVHAFSSCYELYQDMSNRIMAVLATQAPRIEVYSIDEAWLDLSGLPESEYAAWGRDVRDTVLRQVGIPVGVGIGPTKTLAKLANWAAKTWAPKTGWVVDLSDPCRQARLLKLAPVEEVWGIGPRLTRRLADMGVKTAWELAKMDARLLRRIFGVTVERTARELAGERCFEVGESPGPKQMIAATRSFGRKITRYEDIAAAIATHTVRAAAKLRAQGSLCQCLQVFARTSAFAKQGQSYSGQRIVALPCPTDDSRTLVSAALEGLAHLYREGPRYAKAGIVLSQFVAGDRYTPDLFAPPPRPKSHDLMRAMDAINAKMGRATVRLAREDAGHGWQMRRELLSPRYTTVWEDLAPAG